ncbi:hypothetical protein IFM89_028020 [Coptis chinensis]|uniref:Uncharacterized protein n=1 Tax=Coptis chinensis TaxID=261450 RepID=A0A835LT59_9MAGN|nr:hypothetical protein IFM89_028020 [Coptis chinensis]
MGFALDFGVKGIWCGMITGTLAQMCILFFITYRTKWDKEASDVGDRIQQWRGKAEDNVNDIEKKNPPNLQ